MSAILSNRVFEEFTQLTMTADRTLILDPFLGFCLPVSKFDGELIGLNWYCELSIALDLLLWSDLPLLWTPFLPLNLALKLRFASLLVVI